MSANLLRGCEAEQCHRTFAHEHGAAAGGPFPGTNGSDGDVRRCEHGRLWIWHHCYGYTIDCWEPISRFWQPLLYRRARRAALADRAGEGRG